MFETTSINGKNIALLISNEPKINTVEDGLDLIGNLYFQGFDSLIINEVNLAPQFFELHNGLAGEILQKFSNYRIRLAIVGNFDKYESKKLNEFIYESSRGGNVIFVSSTEEALKLFSK